MARRYQKMQAMLPEIKQMLEEGKSQREVAEILGSGRRQAGACLVKARKEKADAGNTQATRAQTCKNAGGIQTGE